MRTSGRVSRLELWWHLLLSPCGGGRTLAGPAGEGERGRGQHCAWSVVCALWTYFVFFLGVA